MKNETDIVSLISEGKYFALIRIWKQHAVYDDTDRYIEGWNTDSEEVTLISFENATEMEDYLADLSVTTGESEGTQGHKIILCQPERYWEYAERERQDKEEVKTE